MLDAVLFDWGETLMHWEWDPAVLEAPVDRQEREGGVVLAARETFLLHGADGHAIDHECCRRIVVVR